MAHTQALVEALGGTMVFKQRLSSPDDLRQAIHRGLPYRALEAMAEQLGLDLLRIAKILHLPSRTMARRKLQHRLNAQESDRLVRVARVVASAVEIFGGWDKASTWLTRPNRALQRKVPLDLLDTDVGTREVEAVLGRLEHGVIG